MHKMILTKVANGFVDPNSPVFKSAKADNEDCYYDKNSNRWRNRNAK